MKFISACVENSQAKSLAGSPTGPRDRVLLRETERTQNQDRQEAILAQVAPFSNDHLNQVDRFFRNVRVKPAQKGSDIPGCMLARANVCGRREDECHPP